MSPGASWPEQVYRRRSRRPIMRRLIRGRSRQTREIWWRGVSVASGNTAYRERSPVGDLAPDDRRGGVAIADPAGRWSCCSSAPFAARSRATTAAFLSVLRGTGVRPSCASRLHYSVWFEWGHRSGGIRSIRLPSACAMTSRLFADSDEAARVHRTYSAHRSKSDAAHQSNLMAPSTANSPSCSKAARMAAGDGEHPRRMGRAAPDAWGRASQHHEPGGKSVESSARWRDGLHIVRQTNDILACASGNEVFRFWLRQSWHGALARTWPATRLSESGFILPIFAAERFARFSSDLMRPVLAATIAATCSGERFRPLGVGRVARGSSCPACFTHGCPRTW